MEPTNLEKAYSSHPRAQGQNRWVYPVLSRRAHGISIGINLNLDKACNFDCAYCQVDRRPEKPTQAIFVPELEQELLQVLREWTSDHFQSRPVFAGIDTSALALRDIALSGDGEPTQVPEFPDVCRMLRTVQSHMDNPPKLVLITNASLLDRTAVRQALGLLCEADGEVWGKLDAGTDLWYQTIARTRVPLDRVEQNLAGLPTELPLRLQSMFCGVSGSEPDDEEIEAWATRVTRIWKARKGEIRSVQIYTLARPTPALNCTRLSEHRLEQIRERLQAHCPGLACEVYP